jgi:hypothetical protein
MTTENSSEIQNQEIRAQLSCVAGDIIRVYHSLEMYLNEVDNRKSPIGANMRDTLDDVGMVFDDQMPILHATLLSDEDLGEKIDQVRGQLQNLIGDRYGLTARLFEKDRAAYVASEMPLVRNIIGLMGKEKNSTAA